MNITTDVHRVKAISVRTGKLTTGTVYTEFTLVTDDGEFTVSAYSKDHLAIKGADHLAHVANGEQEPA